MASGSPPALLPQFEDALEAFTQALTSREKADFQFTTVTDVHRAIERIQKEQEQKHLQRGMKRIWPFVDCLIRYSAVIEQFVTIHPEILAPIWGPLKFILQVSKNAKKSFDIVISALTKIGHCLPRFTMFADIFKKSPRFSQVLVWLYTDILEFYSEVLKFFRKNPTEQFFSALWSKFDDHFEYLLGRFESHAALVDAEANAADLNEAYNFRATARKEFLEAAKERERLVFEEATTWLAPLSFDDEIQRFQDLGGTFPNSGKWLLNDPRFSAWATGAGKPVLWLSGIPGSGKTILSFIAWKYLSSEATTTNDTTIAIFLSDRSRGIHSATSVLQTIAYYLLVSDRTLLTLFSELRASLQGRQDARTRKSAEQLVDRLVSAISVKKFRVIIDGIDEIDGCERIPLLKFLLQLSTTYAKSFSVLISGREEWDIKGKLSSYPKIIVNENNGEDIGLYVQACRNELMDQFYPHLRLEDITIMLKPLPIRSDGMFLFARLVILNLKQQTNLAQLREAAEDLPKGLDEAKRAPRVIEITHALTIQVGGATFNRDRLLIKELDELCGPIVEIRKDLLFFVHFSAKEYLQLHESGLHPELSMANFAMASRCLTYLNFDCFRRNLTTEAITKYLEQGEYLWLDYVQCYWLEHLRAAIKERNGDVRTLETLVHAVILRWRRSAELESKMWNSSLSLGFDCFKERSPNIYEALHHAAMYKSQSNRLEADQDPFLLSEFCTMIWENLEAAVQINPPRNRRENRFQDFYGINIFRCPQAGCAYSTNPFATTLERDAHMRLHSRPFKCGDSCCEYSRLGFASQRALSKHEEIHSTVESTVNSVERLNLVETSVCPVTITQTQTNWDILSDALISDNVELVKVIIGNCMHYIDASWPKVEGWPLYDVRHSAANNCNVLVCNAIVPTDWSRRDHNPHYNPLLYKTIISGSTSTLRWLLDNGFGSDMKLPENRAIQIGNMEIRMRYNCHDTAVVVLMVALEEAVKAAVDSNLEAVQLLLQHGAQVTSKTFCAAINMDNLGLVELLLSHGADCHMADGMLEAVTVSDDMTRFLLDCGADLDTSGYTTLIGNRMTALTIAAFLKKRSTLQLLLDRGVDPTKGLNQQALKYACEFTEPNAECVNILLEAGADANYNNGSAIRVLAGQGNSVVLKLLLDKGADPDKVSPDRRSALKTALTGTKEPQALCAKILLESGADPSVAGKGKAAETYALARKFPQYFGVTFQEVVEANKHKVPGYVEGK